MQERLLKRNRTPRTIRSNRKGQRNGAALVEFALVAPLMMLFTLGLIDLGRMTMVKQLIINASNVGARKATLINTNSQAVVSEVQSLLSNSGVACTVTLTPELLSTAPPGSTVTVTVVAQANSVSWLGTSLFMADKMLTASTSMRRESL